MYRSPSVPASARNASCDVLTMRFFSVAFPTLRGEKRRGEKSRVEESRGEERREEERRGQKRRREERVRREVRVTKRRVRVRVCMC